jgi:TonB family protein
MEMMPINGFDWLRRSVVSAMVSTALMAIVPISTVADSSNELLDVSKMEQGACAAGQVSTDLGCVTLPKLTKRVIPQYPPRARQAHMKGRVTLAIIIEPDGTVSSPTVENSTRPGFGFEEASIHAVSQWEYKPARLGDKPLRVRYTEVMEFSIP